MPDFLTNALQYGGKPEGFSQYDLGFSPEQKNVLNQALSMGKQGISGGLPSFEPIRQKALSDYNNMTVGNIGEKSAGFFGPGQAQNAQFSERIRQNSLKDLLTNLAAQESSFGQTNFQNAMRSLGVGLTPQQGTQFNPRERGYAESGIMGLAEHGPKALANYFGTPGEGGENFLDKLKAYLKEASEGAAIGSAGGPWGTATGAVTALLAKFFGFTGNKNPDRGGQNVSSTGPGAQQALPDFSSTNALQNFYNSGMQNTFGGR